MNSFPRKGPAGSKTVTRLWHQPDGQVCRQSHQKCFSGKWQKVNPNWLSIKRNYGLLLLTVKGKMCFNLSKIRRIKWDLQDRFSISPSFLSELALFSNGISSHSGKMAHTATVLTVHQHWWQQGRAKGYCPEVLAKFLFSTALIGSDAPHWTNHHGPEKMMPQLAQI